MRRRRKTNIGRMNLDKRLLKQEKKVIRTTGLIYQDLRLKIEELEDIEAIHKLKAAYCDACDDDHNGDAVAALFAKGGTWQQISESGHVDSRKYVGSNEIARFMFGLRNAGFIVRSSHIVTNPVIKISDLSATGNWKFLMLYTHVDGSHHRIIGRYEDTYVKVKSDWYFKSLTAIVEENGIYLTESAND